MPFDISAAKKAGYSSAEIADYLGPQQKFDVDSARQSGYSDDEIVKHLSTSNKKTLFSLEGVSSTLRSIGPNLAKGILGEQLAGLEEVIDSRDKAIKAGKRGPLTQEEQQSVSLAEEKRRAIQEASFDLQDIQGDPSYPLELAQGVTNSLAQNLPGIAAAVATRNTGMAASVVPLVGAQKMQEGQTYAESRVDKKGSIEESQANANVQGAVEAGFELLPTSYLIKRLGKDGFQKFLGHYVLKEWGTELPTTLAQNVSDWATIEKDMPVGQFVHKTLGDLMTTAIVTPFAAGGQAAVAHGIAAVSAEPGEVATAPIQGDIPPPVMSPTPPPWKWPTAPAVGKEAEDVQALIDSIDADMLDDNEIAKAKADVAAFDKQREAPVLPNTSTNWPVLGARATVDSGELGASIKETRNATNYVNPNTEPREERPILIGPSGTEGKSLSQVEPEAGTYTIGQPSEDRSEDYLRSLHETIESWRQKFLPNSTFIVSNEELPFGSALGWHYGQNGQHIIVPAAIRSPTKGLGAFNSNKQVSAFYNATHEFGHALIEDRFFEGIDPLVGQHLQQEAQKGLISEETIATLPEAQAAIIREYNTIKQAVLSGQMSASEFVRNWMGPGKAGRKNILEGIDPMGPAMALVNKIATQAVNSSGVQGATARAQIRAELSSDLLGLHEYLAEQTARHAYSNKWDQTSVLGQYFKGALDSLRAFFTGQKRDGIIAPGIAFTSWMEGLTKTEQITNPTEIAKNAAQTKKTVTKTAKEKGPKKPKVVVERTQSNVETDTHDVKHARGTELITDLMANGQLAIGSPEAVALLKLLRQQDYDEFIDLYKKFSGKKVQFELGDSTTEKVGLTTDIGALIKIFGLNMYSGKVPDIIVKELVQNSFDAIKSLVYNKKQETGNILIRVNPTEYTISVSDNGIGMDKQTLLKALLTYPGTSKPDLPPEQRSGGLGQAKQLLLFTPVHIQVVTSQNGITTTLNATPQQLLDNQAQLDTVNNGVANGTVVTVTLPKEVERDGVMTPVEIPTSSYEYSVLSNPPLFPGINIQFVGKYGVEKAESFLETHTLLIKETYDFGYVDIYTGPVHERGYQAHHRVMSAGIWQFDTAIKNPIEPGQIPIDLIFDVHSTVEGQHSAYPFTPNRQGLKPAAQTQLSKAVSSVVDAYVKEILKKHIAAYTNVLELPAVPENTPPGVQIELVQPKYTIAASKDGLPEITFVRGVDAPPSVFYNPTNKDFMSIPDAGLYFSKIAGIHRDFINVYSNRYDPKGQIYSAGIGLDRGTGVKSSYNNGWGGLHFRKPYHAMWINPVYDVEQTEPLTIAASIMEIMIHEAMHINAGGHDAAAFWEYHKMVSKINAGDDLVELQGRLVAVVTQHLETHLAISEMYNDPTTANDAPTVKGDVSRRVASDDSLTDTSEALRRGGEPDSSGSNTTGNFRNVSYELDLNDDSRNDKFLKGIRNFMGEVAPLRTVLRKLQGMAYWALEIQQLAHLNPDLTDLAFFNELNTRYNIRKAELQAIPDHISSIWQRQNDKDFASVNKALLDEMEGGENWFELKKTQKQIDGRPYLWYQFEIGARALDELNKRGIDITTAQGEALGELILEIKNDLLDKMNEKERVLRLAITQRRPGASADVLVAAIKPLMKQFQDMRKRPFFPQGRFGKLMLIVERAKEGGGYEVVYREAFENRTDWQKAWKAADANKKADERVQAKELTDQQYVLMSLPTDFVDIAASELDLSADQVEQLLSLMQPVKTEKVLRDYDLTRLGIKGYSTDAMRSYANYSWHDANLIAKMEFRSKFNLAIRSLGAKLREAQYAGQSAEPEVFRLTRTKTAMERTRDYIMAPPNEAQMLRGIVSVTYLALNVKTALMNLAGLSTTWAGVTEKEGLIPGTIAMTKATIQMMRSIKFTNLNERSAGNYLDADTQKALDLALKQGVLSQSYAYHLAGVANASNLFRLPAKQLIKRTSKQMIDAAMYPFRLTELGTRRVSFLASYSIARKDLKLGFQEAYDLAVSRTNILQNDYSLGNRVPFMRGMSISPGNPLSKAFEPVIPLATVFMSFSQQMAFHAYGGYELGERRAMKVNGETPRHKFGTYTMKLWVIMLLLAGYEGLPGAENFLDLLEAFWRKYGGGKTIRQELREFIQGIEGVDLDPQLFAHGFGHNVAGFDVSRSVGLGRLVPGTDTLANPGDNFNETVGALMLDMLGPTGGLAKFGLETAFSNKSPAEAFQKLPGGMGNIYTAYYWTQHGVTAPNGALVTHDLETKQLRDLTATEIFGKTLGFNPTVVSENRAIRFDQYDRQMYYQSRRKGLLDDVWKARWQHDKEAEKDARTAVIDYNASIPAEYKALRIGGGDIAKSMQARLREKIAAEKQVPTQHRYRGLYKDVLESYDPTSTEP